MPRTKRITLLDSESTSLDMSPKEQRLSSSPLVANSLPNSKKIRHLHPKDREIIMRAEAVLSRSKVAGAHCLQETDANPRFNIQEQEQEQEQEPLESPDHSGSAMPKHQNRYKFDFDSSTLPANFAPASRESSPIHTTTSDRIIEMDGDLDESEMESNSPFDRKTIIKSTRLIKITEEEEEEYDDNDDEMEIRTEKWLRASRSPPPPASFLLNKKDDSKRYYYTSEDHEEDSLLMPPSAAKKNQLENVWSLDEVVSPQKENKKDDGSLFPQTPKLKRLNLIDPGATPFNPLNWRLPMPLKPKPFQSKGTIYTINDSQVESKSSIDLTDEISLSADGAEQTTQSSGPGLCDAVANSLYHGAEATAGIHPKLSKVLCCVVVAIFAYIFGRFSS